MLVAEEHALLDSLALFVGVIDAVNEAFDDAEDVTEGDILIDVDELDVIVGVALAENVMDVLLEMDAVSVGLFVLELVEVAVEETDTLLVSVTVVVTVVDFDEVRVE